MPLKFEVKKKLFQRSERVKSVEFHPENTWILAALYSGNVCIYDYSTSTTVKTFEVSSSPARSAKFLVRKQWIITATDDMLVRVFNYNTMEKIKEFEAHADFIRCVLVHPTLSYLLTCSDDCTIKIFDYEKNFTQVKSFEDHEHYVMQMVLNPRDYNILASASLDKTLKVWNLASTGKNAHFTLTGHQSGVNTLDYYKGDKPYIISGGDDKLIKIWDYQTKICIHTLEGHQNNISFVMFHPEIPIILSTAEDGILKIWHSLTYRYETQLNYNMDRAWGICIAYENSNIIGIGYDEGTIVIKMGNDEPIASMNNGKLLISKNLEIHSTNLKALNTNDEELVKDGEKIQNINYKDLGTSDIYPLAIKHNPFGHAFSINDDHEYQIYRTQTFKNISFGEGTNLVWASNGDYAVRLGSYVKIISGQTNNLIQKIKPDFAIDEIFGGPLLAIRNSEFIVFYDWETCKIIRRIDIVAKKIYWNEAGNLIAITTTDDFYVLAFNKPYVQANLSESDDVEGLEESFVLVYDIHEMITSGIWIQDIFIFTNINGKINYSVSGKVFNYTHTDKKKFLLQYFNYFFRCIIGYINNQNRLYLIDKHFNLTSFEVPYNVIEYQSSIIQNDEEKAEKVLQKIEIKYYDKIAKFLEQIDQKELAFSIVQDISFKFDLAINLNKIEEAFAIAKQINSQQKWKQIGDLALLSGKIQMAIECYKSCDDLSGQYLIYTSLGMRNELYILAQRAMELSRANIAFNSYFLLADLDKCIEVLVETGRIPEAALFAKTYCPSKITELTQQWKESLKKKHPVTCKNLNTIQLQFLKKAMKIANPFDFPDHFSDLYLCTQIESHIKSQRETQVPAYLYDDYQQLLSTDLFEMLKNDKNANITEIRLTPNQEEITVNPCIENVHLKNLDEVEVEQLVEGEGDNWGQQEEQNGEEQEGQEVN